MKYILATIMLAVILGAPLSGATPENKTTAYAQPTKKHQYGTEHNTVSEKKQIVTNKTQEDAREDNTELKLKRINEEKAIELTGQLTHFTKYLVIVGIAQVLIFLLQLFVFGYQGFQLKRTVAFQRAWVFAGCGKTELLKSGRVRAHPDHRNIGTSPAFVEHVCIDYWPKSEPLPKKPDYKTKYRIMDPLPPDQEFRSIGEASIDKELTEETYIYGRIFYRDALDKGTQRFSSFIYLIKKDGTHIRPLIDEIPSDEYWQWK